MSFLKRLDEISKLQANWDSYGATAASDEALLTSRRLATAIASGELSIVPKNDGGIAFSWLDETVEIIISPCGKAELWFDNDE